MLARAAAWNSAKQAVKTAVAGLISIYVTDLFHLPQGYWAAISALIVMQSNVGATLSASRTRLAGTAVGAVVGGIFVALFGSNIPAFALAVAIAFFTCDALRLADSQRLATVTVAIIMLIRGTSSAWIVALDRFAEVGLGIVIALLVALVLWPNHARRSLRQLVAATLSQIGELYRAVVSSGHGADDAAIETLRSNVSAALRKNDDLLQNALQEAFGPMKERESLALLVHQVERIFHAVESLKLGAPDGLSEGGHDAYAHTFHPALNRLEAGVSSAIESLSKSVAAGKIQPGWPDLRGMLDSLDQQAEQARKAGATAAYPLEDILRFYFLLLASRNLVDELELVHTLAAARLPRGTVYARLRNPFARNASSV
jgi:uncharacterized membrane protein YccC